MPTRLGNVLRSVEDKAGDRYGLSAVDLAPHLLSVASPDAASVYEDARMELDVMVKLVYIWMACTLIALAAFVNDGPWLLVALTCFLLSYVSYQGAIIAASNLGDAADRGR